MPTTYTSLLGLALPATGELSGTWGSTVNTEITSLLDTAVAGTTTLSTDADVTLSTTTGAANQARQAIILWTANGTVTRNITAPAASKTYVVINASAGTQSIVFRGVGPTAGVTVVKGESAVVAWNGSDFIKVSNTSGAGAFTNLSVSGTTTLSGLTASTALALDASKNVVSVTNTGTGNNVLATSPVLTTPNLGTPSAATLTNATGLPVSTGISGLGTGVATALAVNTGAAGAFVVNGGALGTPSSGTVTNLTGTASININGTVGATTPNTGAFTTLSASGVATFSAGTAAAPALTTIGDTDTGVFFPAANTWAVATGASERMRITSGGNIAIGGTNAVTKLAIYDSNVGLVVLNTSDPAAATSAPMLRHPVASGFSSTPAFGFWYSNAGMSMPAAETLGLVTNNQERMRLSPSGNVGIGTTTPAVRLDVAEADTSQIRAVATTNGVDTRLLSQGLSANAGVVGTYSNHPLVVFANSQERMRIDSNGRVQIGLSSGIAVAGATAGLQTAAIAGFIDSLRFSADSASPLFKLVKSRSATVGANVAVQSGDGLGQIGFVGADGTSYLFGAVISGEVDGTPGTNDMPGRLVFSTTADGAASPTERMRISSGGNVGIANNSPQVRFTVDRLGNGLQPPSYTVGTTAAFIGSSAAGSTSYATLISGNAGVGAIFFGDTDADSRGRVQYDHATDSMALWTSNGEKVRITSGGDVGIGTTSPAVKLEVAGQIRTEAPTGGTAANWRLGTVHTVSPTSPNRTIEVDIGGTIYYLHAKTTNN